MLNLSLLAEVEEKLSDVDTLPAVGRKECRRLDQNPILLGFPGWKLKGYAPPCSTQHKVGKRVYAACSASTLIVVSANSVSLSSVSFSSRRVCSNKEAPSSSPNFSA